MSSPIVIVGSGAAGLAAACFLLERDASRHVLLLEADTRVGGRVQTRQLGAAYTESGAAWLHGGCWPRDAVDESHGSARKHETPSPLARWMMHGAGSQASGLAACGLRPVGRNEPWSAASPNPWVHLGLDTWTFVDSVLGATGGAGATPAELSGRLSAALRTWYEESAAAASDEDHDDDGDESCDDEVNGDEKAAAEGPAARLARALAGTMPPAAAGSNAASKDDDLTSRMRELSRYILGCWFGWQLDRVQEEDASCSVAVDDCRGDLTGPHLSVVSLPHQEDASDGCCAICSHITLEPSPAGAGGAGGGGLCAVDRCTLLQCDRIRSLVGAGCEGGMGRLIARMLASCVAAGMTTKGSAAVGSPAGACGVSVDSIPAALAAGRFTLATGCRVSAVDYAGLSACSADASAASVVSSTSGADGAVRVTMETTAAAGASTAGSAARGACVSVAASEVIVAVPASVLLAASSGSEAECRDGSVPQLLLPASMPRIAFSPPLPASLISALRSIRSGQYKKVHIAFESTPLPACGTPFVALLPPSSAAVAADACGRCCSIAAPAAGGAGVAPAAVSPEAGTLRGPRFRIVENGAVIKGPAYSTLSGILYGDDLQRCGCCTSVSAAGEGRPSSPGTSRTTAATATAAPASSSSSASSSSVWSDDECVSALLQQLSHAAHAAGWPALPRVLETHVTAWESSPSTGCGAYSFIPRGVEDVEALQRDLQTPVLPPAAEAKSPAAAGGGSGGGAGSSSKLAHQPQLPRVFLAGEALHCEFMGSLHGAVLSGQAAAKQALRAGAKRKEHVEAAAKAAAGK